MLAKINLYLNHLSLDFNLKSKLVIHSVLLPYLYSFYLYYSKELIQIIIDGFNLTCTYTQPFSPYYEYFILLFSVIVFFRLYINSLVFKQKKYIFWLIIYFIFLIYILFYCDLYSHIHFCWSSEEQKEIYKLHFNLAVVCFIFLYLFISFFFIDLISILFFFFPTLALSLGLFILICFYCQELSYVEFINKPLHNCFQEVYIYLRKIFTIECMNTNINEKVLPAIAESKTEGETIPKTIFQRTGELVGGYRYEQKHVECLKSGMSVEYEDVKNGTCNVIIRQCYENPQLIQSVDTAIKNNLPSSDTVLGSVIDNTVGTPMRVAATPGIETKIEVKENLCREITTKLIRSIESLDLKKSS